jgi:hypothetical protein
LFLLLPIVHKILVPPLQIFFLSPKIHYFFCFLHQTQPIRILPLHPFMHPSFFKAAFFFYHLPCVFIHTSTLTYLSLSLFNTLPISPPFCGTIHIGNCNQMSESCEELRTISFATSEGGYCKVVWLKV